MTEKKDSESENTGKGADGKDTSADSKNTGDQGGAKVEMTDAHWEIAFGHKRFKDLSAKAAKWDEHEETEAKKKGEFEGIITKKDDEIKDLRKNFATVTKKTAIISAASRLGAVDTDVVASLIPMDSIDMDDAGNITTNIDDVVKGILEAKPYLKGSASNVGADKTKDQNNTGGKKQWKLSDLRAQAQDQDWMKANAEEYEAAFKDGRVDMNS